VSRAGEIARRGSVALLALFAFAAAGPGAYAATPVAVVIGNDHYANLPAGNQLDRARDDAQAVANSLQKLGYRVVLRLDASADSIHEAVDSAAAQIEPGSSTVVYFAGHGVEINGANYLIPSDAPSPTVDAATLTGHSIALSSILDTLKGHGAATNVIILDACRSNPYGPRMRGSSGNRGLARTAASSDGFFMIYSAGYGQTALDRLPTGDSDRNSVFTRVLLHYLPQTNLSLVEIAKDLQRDVSSLAAQANHVQTPAYYDQLNGDFTITGQPLNTQSVHGGNYQPSASLPGPLSPAPPYVTPTEGPSPATAEPPSTTYSGGLLALRITGTREAALESLVRRISGTRLSRSSSDLTLDTDTGELRDPAGVVVFRFGHSTDPALYSAVFAKWSLANAVTQLASHTTTSLTLLPGNHNFRSGESVGIDLSSPVAGYVVGFDVGSDGSFAVLAPDPSRSTDDQAHTNLAGRYHASIDITPPYGTDHLIFVVAPEYPGQLVAEIRAVHGRAPSAEQLSALLRILAANSGSIAITAFHSAEPPMP